MSTDRDRYRVELDVDVGRSGGPSPELSGREPRSASTPFRIAVIGDFSARAHRGLVDTGRALAMRRPVRVDRDDLDSAIAGFAPTLTLSGGAEPVTVSFASLDEFHPDSLFQRAPVFRALRDAAARSVAGASLGTSSAGRPSDTPAGVLDAILGDVPLPPGGAAVARPASRPALEPADSGLAAFVAQAVAAHVVRQPNDAELAAEAGAAAAIEATMRAMLHHPELQALEALWRGVALLVDRLDTDASLQIHLVDVSAADLAADLAESPPDESGIFRLLAKDGAGRWGLLAVSFPLGDEPSLLGKLAVVARDLGVPIVAGASSVLAGVNDIGSTPDPDDWSDAEPPGWSELRASAAALHVALVFPRLLLRLPYGKAAEPCELFAFEELPADAHPPHNELLWGSGAFAAALAVGEGFVESGWNLRPAREISSLPLHIYRVKGEAHAVPCAETIIGERAAERLLDRGLSPLLGVRDGDSVMLPRLQSISARQTTLPVGA